MQEAVLSGLLSALAAWPSKMKRVRSESTAILSTGYTLLVYTYNDAAKLERSGQTETLGLSVPMLCGVLYQLLLKDVYAAVTLTQEQQQLVTRALASTKATQYIPQVRLDYASLLSAYSLQDNLTCPQKGWCLN